MLVIITVLTFRVFGLPLEDVARAHVNYLLGQLSSFHSSGKEDRESTSDLLSTLSKRLDSLGDGTEVAEACLRAALVVDDDQVHRVIMSVVFLLREITGTGCEMIF